MTTTFHPKPARFTESRADRGFTLTELVVVIGTIAFLAAFGLSLNAAVGQKGSRAYCASNLRQIGAAILMYAQDQQDKLPLLKFIDYGSPQYPYEMVRFVIPINPSRVFAQEGGPYNLGMLWNNKLIQDGRVFYCPAREQKADNLTYSFYDNPTNHWPYGGDPAAPNPGYVRAGYFYFPQQKTLTNVLTAVGTVSVPVVNPRPSTDPGKTWRVTTPIKTSELDVTRSMVTDMVVYRRYLAHTDRNGASGINALFGDGHVIWQDVQRVPNAFNPALWLAVESSSDVNSLRYIHSLWQP